MRRARATAAIDAARRRVLRFLDADDDYVVCFTANATAAIKLVAEAYPFGRGAPCVLTADNHNSVNGVREFARRAGAAVEYLPLRDDLRLDHPEARLAQTGGGGLFAFPGAVELLRRAASAVARPDRALARLSRPARRRGVPAGARAQPARVPGRLRRAVVLQDVRLSHRASARSSRGATRSRRSRGRGSRAARSTTRRCSCGATSCGRCTKASRTAPPNFLDIAALEPGFALRERGRRAPLAAARDGR